MYVIELDSIEDENSRRLVARKILAARTDMPYAELLEQLKIGGIEYYSAEKEEYLGIAAVELKKFGLTYKIVQKNLPKKEEEPKPQPVKTPQRNVVFHKAELTTTDFSKIHKPIEFETEKKKIKIKNKKINNVLTTVLMTVVLAAFIAFMVVFSHYEPQYKIERQQSFEETRIPKQTDKTKQSPKPAKDETASGKSAENPQNNQTPQQQKEKQVKEALKEADDACVEGAIDTEKLYRVAISFNKYNMQAWQGLLDCFEKKGDNIKAADIRKEMQKLFGENVFDVSKNIAKHGTIENFSAQDNIYRMSYFRQKNSESVEMELFLIGQNIANMGNFDKALIFAKEGANKGFMVSFSLADFPGTFEEFRQKIVINKVGN